MDRLPAPSSVDEPARTLGDMPRPRDVLIQRTPRIEPTYALHICRALPPSEPPAFTCQGLRQAIRQADTLAREQIVDIWYTEDGAYFVPLVRYRGSRRTRGRQPAVDAAGLR